MRSQGKRLTFWALTLVMVILAGCAGRASAAGKVCAVLDTGGENDRGFNEYTLRGAREAAAEAGLDFAHVVSSSDADYAPYINAFVEEGCRLIVTVGFLMGEATAAAARANPDVHFAIIDVAYFPGSGCADDVADCYSREGGLANVTSLVFAEDEVGYLAGTLAGCMTETGVIGTVSGMEIPPVVKFVVGYQNGARAYLPEVETLNVYIPAFNDPYTGKQEGEKQIAAGADIIFGVGGNTGNGGLIAAHDLGLMTIGVDVDQYLTFPEIGSSLLTSAAKRMDVATADAVRAYARGELEGGLRLSTVANGGVGLAPYHDWQARIPAGCKQAVEEAAAGLANGAIATGYVPQTVLK
ncbi:MAG: BMP family ABC transporter substrate-binding protein [Candidatus Promineifilaceae bacterium]